MLNVWRIPILFYISGMGVRFAIRKRNAWQLIKERSLRILLPFLFGIVALVPLHIFLWQKYYRQGLDFSPRPDHLWFLGNIFLYVIICLPLFLYLKNKPESRLNQGLKKLMGSVWGLVAIILVFVIEVLVVQPETFEYYARNTHGFFLGLIAFLFGFLIIHTDGVFWKKILSLRWIMVIIALALYGIRWVYFGFVAPNYLVAIESNLWIFSWFAFGYKYLNWTSPSLRYLTPAAYPVYILHMLFIYLASTWILPMEMGAWMKFVLVSILTFAGCYAGYELIRRVNFLRPLFGLKLLPSKER